jgi:uncharacterized protein
MAPMFLQSLIRWLLPKEAHFFDYLERQAVIAHQAVNVFARFKEGVSLVEIRNDVQDLEHQGDEIVHQMLDALARTFVTPIDREDLQMLSKRLDDITDLLNKAARVCVLFGVEKPTKPMQGMIEKLQVTTAVLKDAVPHLRSHQYQALIDASRKINELERDGDTVFRDALSDLFHDPKIDAKTILREKEVLEDLEKCMNRCDQVAEDLMNIAVKNG